MFISLSVFICPSPPPLSLFLVCPSTISLHMTCRAERASWDGDSGCESKTFLRARNVSALPSFWSTKPVQIFSPYCYWWYCIWLSITLIVVIFKITIMIIAVDLITFVIYFKCALETSLIMVNIALHFAGRTSTWQLTFERKWTWKKSIHVSSKDVKMSASMFVN